MRQNFSAAFFVRFSLGKTPMDEGGEDVEPFEEVYREYFRDVELYLLALCRDAQLAAELTAQVFFPALEKYSEFRGECHVKTWLCAIGRNLYLSHLRKAGKDLPLEESMIDPGVSIEERLENIWVDLFPLDGMPNGFVSRQWHKMRLLVTRLKFHLSCFEKVNIKRPGRPLVERIIIRFAMITHVGSWWNTRKQLDKLDRLLKKYPPEKSRYLVNFTGQTSFKFNEMFRKEIYGQGKAYAFENMTLIGPEQYDPYLKSLYGDYMTPPKESDRNAHAAQLVPVEEVE